MSSAERGRLALATIRDRQTLALEADEAERAEIAERLDLPALSLFTASVTLARQGDEVRASGRLRAEAMQRCVASGEPVPASIDTDFALLFRPEPVAAPDAEIELSGEDLDVVFHDGRTIALGEALADTLALELDPYPRSPAADAALREAGVLSEEQAGPFAALAALKTPGS